MSDIVPDSIATVDGQELSSEEARRVSKRLFIGGFFLLPWLWLANLWLFWPELRSASDTAVYSYARRSALAFACSTVLLMTWMGMFSIGGQKVLGASFFDNWNLANVDPSELQT